MHKRMKGCMPKITFLGNLKSTAIWETVLRKKLLVVLYIHLKLVIVLDLKKRFGEFIP